MSQVNSECGDDFGVEVKEVATSGTATYTILEKNLIAFEASVEKLNRRAKRIGCEPITFTTAPSHVDHFLLNTLGLEGEGFWLHQDNVDSFLSRRPEFAKTGMVRQWLTLTVTGAAPSYEGWKFVATLEPVEVESDTQPGKMVMENIIQSVPGAEKIHDSYRHKVGYCDHCKTARRRNQTFVVKSDATNELKMIGRQCIRDFLGHANPHQLASWAEILVELGAACDSACEEGDEWGFGGGGRGQWAFDMDEYLGVVLRLIRDRGFVSRTKAREMGFDGRTRATADVADFVVTPINPLASEKDKKEWREMREKFRPTAADLEYVAEAREWARNADREYDGSTSTDSDYRANIRAVARMACVTSKTTGLAASIIPAYSRVMGVKLFEKSGVEKKNEHFGTVKARSEFVVMCEKVFVSEGYDGSTGVHKLVGLSGGEKIGKGKKAVDAEAGSAGDVTGKSLVWFASGATEWMKEGETYRVKATVKEHGDYKGWKQTVLTRVEVVERISEGERERAETKEEADGNGSGVSDDAACVA